MKILITGAWQHTPEDVEMIQSLGHSVVEMPDERGAVPGDESEYDGVICNGLFLYHDIHHFTRLRYIQLTSAGYDRVPMDYIRQNNITINNAVGVYSIPIAEFVIGSVLQIYKCSRFFYENQKRHQWEKHRGLLELYGRTVCIVGCGSVGMECAKRFAAFGCRLLGVDLVKRDGMEMVDLDDGIMAADIVVLSLPLTPDTRHIIDARCLSLLKSGAVLVNVARGALIDSNALTDRMAKGDVYAVLDVFEEEPLSPDSDLWEEDNFVITPHNSFAGNGNNERLTELIIRGLEKFIYENIDYRTQK